MVVECREQEYLKLEKYLDMLMNAGRGGIVYISGVPGSGKTYTLSKLLDNRNVIHAFVNVMEFRKKSDVFKMIAKEMECTQCEKILTASDLKKHMEVCEEWHVVVIDEIDMLAGRSQRILYNLFEIPCAERGKLAMFLISNTMDLPERMFEPKVCSRMGGLRVNFAPYTSDQLVRIVGAREMDRKCIELVSKRIGAVSGDARRVYDVMSRIEEDSKGDANVIDANEVMKKMYTPVYVKYLQEIKFDAKVMLRLMSVGMGGRSILEVYEEMEGFYKRMKMETIDYFRFEDVVVKLVEYGMLKRMKNGRQILMMILSEEIEKVLGDDLEYVMISKAIRVNVADR
ncbi:Cdc6-like protein [Ordospora colligata]|uniref:Cdc6-like protein n=1 Tax=Ordospora colligata OC4 TaxID=1354746 RepID=A0A0B2UM85_9MICR|nr:Cdc6-like protein [Ordospora colligata OC4]KHN70085.1 Cdc6-like protein [Ordospora colligata OC4]TBU16467.1 Cdc6-like protein [Ordospora colligata]TBU16652.1 Cdc6-like protein [Ordospora colligata]TBU19225.1 Cdc6-like protein [Ordospora colligata]